MLPVDIRRTALFMAPFEGFVDHVYIDPVGVPTWGYGETDPRYRPANDRITEPEAFALLVMRTEQFANGVAARLTRPASPNQHGAMTSLAYNIGAAGFADSSVLRWFNGGNDAWAAGAFLLWNKGKVNGRLVELAGLTRRRKAEAAWFSESVTAEAVTPTSSSKENPMLVTVRGTPHTYLVHGSKVSWVANSQDAGDLRNRLGDATLISVDTFRRLTGQDNWHPLA